MALTGFDTLYSHPQIEAHTGGVNDIAFSHPNKSLSIITCGDDKTIKVRVIVLFFKIHGKEFFTLTVKWIGVGCHDRTKAVYI